MLIYTLLLIFVDKALYNGASWPLVSDRVRQIPFLALSSPSVPLQSPQTAFCCFSQSCVRLFPPGWWTANICFLS